MQEYKMRRKDRLISREAAVKLLEDCEYGVLGINDATGAPYTVPLSYVFKGNRIYFHSAGQGRKVDGMRAGNKASFCVVGQTRPVYVTDFTTYYESAMAFGTVREVEEQAEKHEALRALCLKYLPDHQNKIDGDIERFRKSTLVFALEAEIISGKSNRPE